MDLEHQPDNLARQKLERGVSSSAGPHENSKPAKAAVLDTGDKDKGAKK